MPASQYQKDSFSRARERMVVSQLQPAGITDERVVEAYRTVERETFIPDHLKSVCYLDDSLQLGDGKVMLEPLLHGLMVSELKVRDGDTALIIGDDTGYSAAILEKLGAVVTPSADRYDVVLVCGAVADIPAALTDRLDSGGRLSCVIVPGGKAIGKIVVVTREASGTLARQLFEDATAAYVSGYAPQPVFTF